MPSRAEALNAVKVGDVIFGLGASGQDRLLLVYRADNDSFSARHITTQATFRFGRDGRTRVYANGGYITIVSTAKLPQEAYEVALGLDRKCAAQPEYPDSILSKAEIQLLLTHVKFFQAHPLPGTEPIVKMAERRNAVRAIIEMEWDPINARDTPPAWNEYATDLPALVSLLEKLASVDEVTDFLADIAARRMRSSAVSGRNRAVAASLVRLQQSWT